LKELKEKVVGEERIVRCTMQPLREVWMRIGMQKIDTHEGVIVKALLDSQATCHKPLLSPSILSLFFSFSFTFCSIYSVGKSVMLCDIRRDGVTSKVTSHITSQDMSHIVWLGVQDNWRTDQVDYV